MDRVRLLKIAKECNKNPACIKKHLEAYFNTPEGQEALEQAPRQMLYTSRGDNISGHQTTRELAISLILQEFQGGGGIGKG